MSPGISLNPAPTGGGMCLCKPPVVALVASIFRATAGRAYPPLSPGIVIFFKNTRQKVVIGSVFLSAREIAFNAFLCEGYGWGQAPALQKDIPQGVMDLSKLTRVVGRM